MPDWYVYLIECRNGAVYTGITTDVSRRYRMHAEGRGARYTRANPPLRLLGQLRCDGRAEASRTEFAIKQKTAEEKRALARTWAEVSICDNV
jgi:putative endonuclease